MRATIRRTNLDALHADVDAAMPLLDIDESATYRSELTIWQPGQPTSRSERTVVGAEARTTIRTLLLLSMHEVEQTAPEAVTVRWTRKSKRNSYRTQSCTFTKVA
ncbi:hypothetical protein [Streptomyces sioyaensis]|uniref:hypothetical protein n=1 Tax=Streptomyces sioyaensis TaxID=67364 RepID=UPI003D720192